VVRSLPQDSNCAENVRRCLTQFDVFVSHAWGKDKSNHERAKELSDLLKQADFTVWFDDDQVSPSKYFNIKPFQRAVRFESRCTPSPRVCTCRPWFSDWFSQTVRSSTHVPSSN
jgi:hypothetical protein